MVRVCLRERERCVVCMCEVCGACVFEGKGEVCGVYV